MKHNLQSKSINKLISLCDDFQINVNTSISKLVDILDKKLVKRGTMPSPMIQEIIDKLKTNEIELGEEKSGYQFIGEEKVPYEPNMFLRGTVPYLIYFFNHLDDIRDTEKSLETVIDDKHIKTAYHAGQLRMVISRISKDQYSQFKQQLANKIELQTRQHYKIHLQPTANYLEQTIFKLANLFKSPDYPISIWKFSIYAPEQLLENFPKDTPPSIVVYPQDGYAQKVLDDIVRITDENWGSGLKPRGNIRINKLIFYAGGDWDVKKEYPDLFTEDLSLYKGQKQLVAEHSTTVEPSTMKQTPRTLATKSTAMKRTRKTFF